MRINQFSNNTLWSRGPSMSRYYFHLRRGRATIQDNEGVELADIEEATNEAERRAQVIAAQHALQGVTSEGAAIVVVNGEGFPIFEAPLKGNDA
jgi:hypothetical protein